MDLTAYKDFLIVCVEASASFIGLLFVALTVVIARMNPGAKLEFNDRRLAEGAFTALANIFFISLTGLLPDLNIGYIALVGVLFGIRSVLRQYVEFRRTHAASQADIRNFLWIGTSALVYLFQAVIAFRIILEPANQSNIDVLMGILVGLFVIGLRRSWELTGVRS